MATVTKDFRVKAGLVVEGATATVEGHNVLTNKIADAKGDLLVGTADNAISRVAVGTNGQVLTADSAETSGVKWAAPAAVGVFDTQITFEGATADDYETTLTIVDPTADRTITLPNATGTVALLDANQTLTNKSIAVGSNTITGTISDFNTALTDADFATLAGSETFTNKTLTTPKINENVELLATATELNILDGAILSTTELNYVDGVTSAIQTQLNDKAAATDLTTHTGASTGVHGVTGSVVGTTDTQTLSSKTLTSPVVSGLALSDSSIVFEGSSADDNETTLTVTNPTADRTITLPDVSGTVITTGDSGTVTSTMIANDTIVDADINSAAAIAQSKISGLTTDLGNKLALAGGTMTGAIAMGTNKITGLGTPTDATDAATKGYVDTAVVGIDWKPSVRAATTGNRDLSELENEEVVDGVTLATGDRVLVKNQSTASENGIYVVKASGAPDRSTDADTGAELTSNFAVFVEEGTVNADQGYVLTNNGAITVGTTELVFTQFTGLGQIIAGTGLDKTGNTLDIDSTVTTNDGTQTLTNKTINGSSNTITNVSLTSGVTGTLPVANGGTGITSLGTGIATFLETPSSSNLAAALTDESGTGTVAFTNSPTFVTPAIGAATGTTLVLSDALTTTAVTLGNTVVGSNLGTAGTSATNIDAWPVSTYSAAKYIIQMKKGDDIELIEMLVGVNATNSVYLTEYANVQSNGELGTTNAVYADGSVILQVTAAAADTSVKLHKIYIEA
jgi:hypothetical protein